MANVKTLWTTEIITGKNVYVIVRRESDGYLLNDADGSFGGAPADPYVSLTEHGTIKSLYEKAESRSAWEPDRYTAFFYEQTGGSPSPALDYLRESKEFFIVGDTLVVNFPYEAAKVATDAANGATTFKTDLSGAVNDYCIGAFIKFASGALAGQIRRITAFNATSKFVTVASGFTGTPADGSEFFVVNQ